MINNFPEYDELKKLGLGIFKSLKEFQYVPELHSKFPYLGMGAYGKVKLYSIRQSKILF